VVFFVIFLHAVDFVDAYSCRKATTINNSKYMDRLLAIEGGY